MLMHVLQFPLGFHGVSLQLPRKPACKWFAYILAAKDFSRKSAPNPEVSWILCFCFHYPCMGLFPRRHSKTGLKISVTVVLISLFSCTMRFPCNCRCSSCNGLLQILQIQSFSMKGATILTFVT